MYSPGVFVKIFSVTVGSKYVMIEVTSVLLIELFILVRKRSGHFVYSLAVKLPARGN